VQILARRPEITAVFCHNDLLAAGVLFECLQRDWAVPGRIAVMGFGDLAVARAASPRLSTVLIRRAEMGERAGQMLLARFAGHTPDTKTVDIGFEVVARGST
jgi:LacI family gluconate utilization system Gnt-I transcriptional repressor